MFKKTLFAAAAAAMLAGLTACSSLATAPNTNGLKLTESDSAETLAHVQGEIWGVYLFNILPLFTGNAAKPGNCSVFRDTVTVENCVRMITRKGVQLDATRMLDMTSTTSSFPILFFTVRTVKASGNAVK